VNATTWLSRIERQRDVTYRRTRARRVRTCADAAQFIDSVGFSLLFASTQGIELPSLFEAVKGRRDAHIEEWDADSDRVWVWKNDLPATRRAYYGKALSGKPIFIALKFLPDVYALAAPENLARAYARGEISRDAKRICDALGAQGPTPTIALAEVAGFGRARREFHRALDELQSKMIIAPVGAVAERGAWVSQIFDLTARWFAPQVARAARLNVDDARRALVQRYIATVIACTQPMIARVFGFSRIITRQVIADLSARDVIAQKSEWIISNRKQEA
jgi:hypothetical protein